MFVDAADQEEDKNITEAEQKVNIICEDCIRSRLSAIVFLTQIVTISTLVLLVLVLINSDPRAFDEGRQYAGSHIFSRN